MQDRSTSRTPFWQFIATAGALLVLLYFLQIHENPISEYFLSLPVDLPN